MGVIVLGGGGGISLLAIFYERRAPGLQLFAELALASHGIFKFLAIDEVDSIGDVVDGARRNQAAAMHEQKAVS